MATETYTAEMARAAVERGARFLDEKCPDWVQHINLKRLDLNSSTYCVLGQTAKCLLAKKPDGHAMRGGYHEVRNHYGLPVLVDMGFTCASEWDPANAQLQFEMLEIAWRELIRQRLEQQS